MKLWLAERLQEYEKQFESSPEASEYLALRGISSEVAKGFRVGYVAPGKALRGDARYEGYLAIPYLTISGVVSFKFRSIDPHSTIRFMKDAHDPNRLFNTRVLQRAQSVVLCEGELDAIAAAQCGFDAVGIPGANNWKPEWSRVFANRQVTVLADGDDAGREFAESVTKKLYLSKSIDLPDGEDVASMLKLKGEDWIRERVLG
jgi:DNA primase